MAKRGKNPLDAFLPSLPPAFVHVYLDLLDVYPNKNRNLPGDWMERHVEVEFLIRTITEQFICDTKIFFCIDAGQKNANEVANRDCN